MHSNFIITELLGVLMAVMDREVEQIKESGILDLPNVTVINPTDMLGGSLLGWSPDFKLRDSAYTLTKELLKDVKIN